MRRSTFLLLSGVFAIGVLLVGGRAIATAQTSSGPDYSGHPLVGSWSLISDPDPEAPPSQDVFSPDGAYIEVDGEGGVVIGAWEPTGDTTANMMFTGYDPDGSGFRVRASIEVAADGQSFTANYTLEMIDPVSGSGSGEYGPSPATGTRLTVEPQGTPVGTMEDFFSQFEEDAEATPVS